jgi:hypothetical protein
LGLLVRFVMLLLGGLGLLELGGREWVSE